MSRAPLPNHRSDRRPQSVSRTLQTLLTLLVVWLMPPASSAVFAQNGDCYRLPNGTISCSTNRRGNGNRPAPSIHPLTQCALAINSRPDYRAPEDCRAALVGTCRTHSDNQFAHQFQVQRPRLLNPAVQEMTTGWNRYCATDAGYRYLGFEPRPNGSPTGGAQPALDARRSDPLRAAGAYRYLIEPFDTSSVPSLKVEGPCRCDDGTEPVYGFCTDGNRSYKIYCDR